MSTESRARFRRTFAVVIGVLVVLAGIGAVAGSMQGPRITGVQSDPSGAIEAAGSRVVLTTNQVLADVDAADVTVTPAAEHTVDVSGRAIGIRFTQPLDAATDYEITISGAHARGGGPSAELATAFTTPAAELYLLERTGGSGDSIVRAGLDGAEPVEIYRHAHIEDFRRAGDLLVVSVVEADLSALVVIDTAGTEVRRLDLPGTGNIAHLQVSDRGGLVGYLFSDHDISAEGGRASVLFTMPIAGGTPEPALVDGAEASVDDWRFVPDATAMLFIDFNSELLLSDPTSDAEPTRLGFARTIDGMSRGTYTAIIQRQDVPIRVDLRTAEEAELTPPARSGTTEDVTPLAGDDLLWPFTVRDAAGMPLSLALVISDGDESRQLLSVPIDDPVLQVCASPSGSHLALMVAPDFVSNPYMRGYQLSVPTTVETRIVRSSDGEEVTRIPGFDISWCTSEPR